MRPEAPPNCMPQSQTERHRATLVAYLRVKVEQEDWHGVSDAANDLRELDAAWRARRNP